MKQFNLEEYLKNPSRKVVTRDGRSARIICTDFNNNSYPIIVEIQGETEPETVTKEGLVISRNCDSESDLFFAPEKHEGWVNVYKGGDRDYFTLGAIKIYGRKEDAEACRVEDCVATVKIEWEE